MCENDNSDSSKAGWRKVHFCQLFRVDVNLMNYYTWKNDHLCQCTQKCKIQRSGNFISPNEIKPMLVLIKDIISYSKHTPLVSNMAEQS